MVRQNRGRGLTDADDADVLRPYNGDRQRGEPCFQRNGGQEPRAAAAHYEDVLDHDHPPVVAWSPDHATVPTEGLRSSHQRVDLRSKKVTWSGDHATTARPCYNRVPIVTCCLAGANLLGHRRRPMA